MRIESFISSLMIFHFHHHCGGSVWGSRKVFVVLLIVSFSLLSDDWNWSAWLLKGGEREMRNIIGCWAKYLLGLQTTTGFTEFQHSPPGIIPLLRDDQVLLLRRRLLLLLERGVDSEPVSSEERAFHAAGWERKRREKGTWSPMYWTDLKSSFPCHRICFLSSSSGDSRSREEHQPAAPQRRRRARRKIPIQLHCRIHVFLSSTRPPF